MIIPSDFIFVNSISRNMHKRFMDFFKAVVIMTVETKNKAAPLRGVQLRKHSKAREKGYSFGYAVSFIFACYQILWTFPKSRYLCSRYLPLACG